MLNIRTDTMVDVMYQNEAVQSGRLNPADNTLIFRNGHHVDRYRITGRQRDSVTLQNLLYGNRRRKMVRYDPDLDHLRRDYFVHDDLMIDLPLAEPGMASIETLKPIHRLEIIVGRPVANTKYSDRDFVVRLGDRIVHPLDRDDLWLYREQHFVKLPERLRPNVRPVIFADAATPDSLLRYLREVYASLGSETIYRVYEKPGNDRALELAVQPMP